MPDTIIKYEDSPLSRAIATFITGVETSLQQAKQRPNPAGATPGKEAKANFEKNTAGVESLLKLIREFHNKLQGVTKDTKLSTNQVPIGSVVTFVAQQAFSKTFDAFFENFKRYVSFPVNDRSIPVDERSSLKSSFKANGIDTDFFDELVQTLNATLNELPPKIIDAVPFLNFTNAAQLAKDFPGSGIKKASIGLSSLVFRAEITEYATSPKEDDHHHKQIMASMDTDSTVTTYDVALNKNCAYLTRFEKSNTTKDIGTVRNIQQHIVYRSTPLQINYNIALTDLRNFINGRNDVPLPILFPMNTGDTQDQENNQEQQIADKLFNLALAAEAQNANHDFIVSYREVMSYCDYNNTTVYNNFIWMLRFANEHDFFTTIEKASAYFATIATALNNNLMILDQSAENFQHNLNAIWRVMSPEIPLLGTIQKLQIRELEHAAQQNSEVILKEVKKERQAIDEANRVATAAASQMAAAAEQQKTAAESGARELAQPLTQLELFQLPPETSLDLTQPTINADERWSAATTAYDTEYKKLDRLGQAAVKNYINDKHRVFFDDLKSTFGAHCNWILNTHNNDPAAQQAIARYLSGLNNKPPETDLLGTKLHELKPFFDHYSAPWQAFMAALRTAQTTEISAANTFHANRLRMDTQQRRVTALETVNTVINRLLQEGNLSAVANIFQQLPTANATEALTPIERANKFVAAVQLEASRISQALSESKRYQKARALKSERYMPSAAPDNLIMSDTCEDDDSSEAANATTEPAAATESENSRIIREFDDCIIQYQAAVAAEQAAQAAQAAKNPTQNTMQPGCGTTGSTVSDTVALCIERKPTNTDLDKFEQHTGYLFTAAQRKYLIDKMSDTGKGKDKGELISSIIKLTPPNHSSMTAEKLLEALREAAHSNTGCTHSFASPQEWTSGYKRFPPQEIFAQAIIDGRLIMKFAATVAKDKNVAKLSADQAEYLREKLSHDKPCAPGDSGSKATSDVAQKAKNIRNAMAAVANAADKTAFDAAFKKFQDAVGTSTGCSSNRSWFVTGERKFRGFGR